MCVSEMKPRLNVTAPAIPFPIHCSGWYEVGTFLKLKRLDGMNLWSKVGLVNILNLKSFAKKNPFFFHRVDVSLDMSSYPCWTLG